MGRLTFSNAPRHWMTTPRGTDWIGSGRSAAANSTRNVGLEQVEAVGVELRKPLDRLDMIAAQVALVLARYGRHQCTLTRGSSRPSGRTSPR
jgi:hypothetical protein